MSEWCAAGCIRCCRPPICAGSAWRQADDIGDEEDSPVDDGATTAGPGTRRGAHDQRPFMQVALLAAAVDLSNSVEARWRGGGWAPVLGAR